MSPNLFAKTGVADVCFRRKPEARDQRDGLPLSADNGRSIEVDRTGQTDPIETFDFDTAGDCPCPSSVIA